MATSPRRLRLLVQLLLHCSTSGLLIAPAAAAAATLRPTAASLRSVPQYTRQSSRAGCIVAREINKLETREDYDALISAAKAENRVVVIKFYASWCRACKAMAPKFARLVDDWPEIEFYEILFDNNKVRPESPRPSHSLCRLNSMLLSVVPLALRVPLRSTLAFAVCQLDHRLYSPLPLHICKALFSCTP